MPEQYPLPHIPEEPARSSGLWPSQQLHQAMLNGMIVASNEIHHAQVQPASLDLRLDTEAYALYSSFLPGQHRRVRDRLKDFARDRLTSTANDGSIRLERGSVYLFKLQEHLRLRRRISAKCNAKSSTGRLDIFARVVTDFSDTFDEISESYCGELWLEISPRSFDIVVRPGSRLVQLRVRSGRPASSNRLLRDLDQERQVIKGARESAEVRDRSYVLTADLMGRGEGSIVGYRARKGAGIIDIDRRSVYDPVDFWEPIYRADMNNLVLHPDEFHILASRERIMLPPDYAAEMVAYDTQIGEFRVHYAGFFDPGFGYEPGNDVATPAVLEVRSHEVPFSLEHGQIIGRLMLEPLRMGSEKHYGSSIGSHYQKQGLSLSKHFRPFPEKEQGRPTKERPE